MSTSLLRFVRGLIPTDPVVIATVVAVRSDGTSLVEFPDGSRATARGTTVAAGSAAFIRAGAIEGLAPARTATVIEI